MSVRHFLSVLESATPAYLLLGWDIAAYDRKPFTCERIVLLVWAGESPVSP